MDERIHAVLADPVIRRFRSALTDAYGARIERGVVFGSRARVDARADPDHDVAVFRHDPGDRGDGIDPVKRDAGDALWKADHCLEAARRSIALNLSDAAAGEACLAIDHAAHGYIFELCGRAVQTREGLQTVFSHPSKDDPRLVPGWPSLLARACQYQETGDDGTGVSAVVPIKDAQDPIDRAKHCIETIATTRGRTPGPAKDPTDP